MIQNKEEIATTIDSKFIVDFFIKDKEVIKISYMGNDFNNPQTLLSVYSPNYINLSIEELTDTIIYHHFGSNKNKVEIIHMDSIIEEETYIWNKETKMAEEIKVNISNITRYKGRSKIPQNVINKLYGTYLSIDKPVPIYPNLPLSWKTPIQEVVKEQQSCSQKKSG